MSNERYSPQNWYRYADDVHINYEESGTGGSAVVFLPGFGDSLQVWNDVRARFAASDHTLYFLELKGFGFSSKPKPGDYGLQEQAAIVGRFLREKALEQVTLVGHSYGGAVALVVYDMLREDGDRRIEKLVLIDAAAFLQKIPTSIDLLRLPGLNQVVSYLIPSVVKSLVVLLEAIHDRGRITSERIRMHAFFFSLPGARESFMQVAQQLIPADYDELTSRYGSISIPVLLIWGEKDRYIPLEAGVRLDKVLANSRLEVIENCGHAAHEERPDRVYSLISEFLEKDA